MTTRGAGAEGLGTRPTRVAALSRNRQNQLRLPPTSASHWFKYATQSVSW